MSRNRELAVIDVVPSLEIDDSLRPVSVFGVDVKTLHYTLVGVCWALIISAAPPAKAVGPETDVQFQRLTLSEEFHSEGADFADINGDQHNDIISGPFWYQGPDFRQRHRYMPGDRHSIKAYSDHFFTFAHDFNHDGRPDVLVIGMPGQPAHWFQNPGDEMVPWKQHPVIDDVGGESPAWMDLTGDGNPELVCVRGGRFGYAQPDWKQPTEAWTFTPVSPDRGYGRFTHGLGVGDVDGDGHADLLETNGWYAGPSKSADASLFHQQAFAQSGGAQMHVYDFDGDGDNDVVSVQNAHAWGLTWFQRRGSGDDQLWVPHPILSEDPSDNPYRLAISQMHALALADIDGDGVQDLITGKRFYAHGGADPGAFQLPVLYWLRTVRLPGGGVEFQPHLIDNRVGVGTQLTVADINRDGRADILVAGKLGTYLLINQQSSSPITTAVAVGSEPGTGDFALGVRNSEPLSPQQEQQSFVLPPGFEAQLVAAEPEIDKPLNMAFDAQGRLWVTCTREYPYPVEVGTPGRDSIKILEDRDGDGRADQITTFADGLNIPIGLYPYKDGVICYSIPHIWHLRDTDGDGKCDQRDKLYGPFDHTRDTHGMCNSFTRGYDGWMYACHGFNNQSTVAGQDGHAVTMHSGNTFRIRLDGSRIEHYTYGQVNPFGMAYDARGDLLTADCHTKPVTLLIRGGHYDSFGRPHYGLGYVPDVMDHLHGSTAIGGIAVCTDSSSFPKVYQNSAFGGNVMTSRVNRNSLIYRGGSLQAQEESDFLISGDPWFRPVDLQFGPDGGLYVADFYNRIIGHYEEPLNHPGRDRTSGRIWKIVYRPHDDRRDPSPASGEQTPVALESLDLDRLIARLDSPLLATRMRVADRIVDHIGTSATDVIRHAYQSSSSPRQRIHLLWILYRLEAVTQRELDDASSADDSLLRAHAFRVRAELDDSFGDPSEPLLAGFADPDPLVRREAVLASAQHSVPSCVTPLMELFRNTPESDPHTRHAIRMALRNQLRDEATFQIVEQNLSSEHVELLAGICLALKTPAAGAFVSGKIDTLATADRETLGQYIKLAIGTASGTSVDRMVQVTRSQFANDRDFQLQVLQSVRADARIQKALPESIRAWAQDLATELLALQQETSPLPWQSLSLGESPSQQAVWDISSRRQSADGVRPTVLWSSFPHGEQRTGIYRSAPFPLPHEFQFWLAGHDGLPTEPIQNKNLVRVCDAKTGEILQTFSPPRNDVAQLQTWNPDQDSTENLVGRSVHVELVDADSGSAFAWLAAGRFSVDAINPCEWIKDRRIGVALAGQFRLRDLRDELVRLGKISNDQETRYTVARAVAEIDDHSHAKSLAEAIAVDGLDSQNQIKIIDAIGNAAGGSELLAIAMQQATASEQLNVARQLVTNQQDTDVLLTLIEAGQASNRLLVAPEIRSKIDVIANERQQQLVDTLTASLPDEGTQVAALIRDRQATFDASKADVNRGKELFAKHCSLCHQVAGGGTQVGPNLDGIGNRGLARICEDILAPHRNVDLSFRSTTILDDDGRVLVGLVQNETDAQLTLIDATGKPHLIDKLSIETRKQTMLSPMPGNIADIIDPSQFNDLLSYLLSLNH